MSWWRKQMDLAIIMVSEISKGMKELPDGFTQM